MAKFTLLVIAILGTGIVACSDDSSPGQESVGGGAGSGGTQTCRPGEERCSCAAGSCDPGLLCLSDLCVMPPNGAGGSAASGSGGAGGSAAVGGSGLGGMPNSGGSGLGGVPNVGGSGGGGGSSGTGGTTAECDGLGHFDATSGLCWAPPAVTDSNPYSVMQSRCQSLAGGLAGWRLPTIGELKAQVVGCAGTQTCMVSDQCTDGDTCYSIDTCEGCEYLAGPGPAGCYWGVPFGTDCTDRLWSSTEVTSSVTRRWVLAPGAGAVVDFDELNWARALCVRPGP